MYAVLFITFRLAIAPGIGPAESDEKVARGLEKLTPYQVDEVVWLARCLYSETHLEKEQRLVAWVIRNRVETKFRGENYRAVVLESSQFSAFNHPSDRREHVLALDARSSSGPWRQALRVAYEVYTARADERPIPLTTRHFYSPVSMKDGAKPAWADGRVPLRSTAFGILPQRFLFFDGVDAEDYQAAAQPHITQTVVRRRPIHTTATRRVSSLVKPPSRPSVQRPGRNNVPR